ncbi:hypothetical protein GQ457_03G024060 [Hibiscus cannabinus]
MMFYTEEVASKLQGSTPHDKLLIQTSESFSGLLLSTIVCFHGELGDIALPLSWIFLLLYSWWEKYD